MTPAERIEVQFGKWNKKFPLDHCTILTKEQVATVMNQKKTAAIVTVHASDGRLLELFPSRLMWGGRSVDYQDIERQEWIDLEREEKVRNKQAHFDRVHIVTRRGITTLDGLGQAVFPLMKAIDMILKAKKKGEPVGTDNDGAAPHRV
jgi:hypothetical protein